MVMLRRYTRCVQASKSITCVDFAQDFGGVVLTNEEGEKVAAALGKPENFVIIENSNTNKHSLKQVRKAKV